MKLPPINTFQLCLDHDEDKWIVIFMVVILCGYSIVCISLMVSVLAIENQETEEESELLQLCSFLLIAYILIVFILMLLAIYNCGV